MRFLSCLARPRSWLPLFLFATACAVDDLEPVYAPPAAACAGPAAPTSLSCSSAPAWWNQGVTYSQQLGRSFLGFSPDGSVLLQSAGWSNQAGHVFDAHDGSPASTGPHGRHVNPGATGPGVLRAGHDAAWTLRLVQETTAKPVQTLLTVRRWHDDVPVRQVALPKAAAAHHEAVVSALTPDGKRIVALVCSAHDVGLTWTGTQVAWSGTLRSWAVADGKPGPVVQLGPGCESMAWNTFPTLEPTADGKGAVVVVPGPAELVVRHVALLTGELHSATIPGGEPVEAWNDWNRIVDLAVRPDSLEVALVVHDGTLRRFSLPDLQPVGTPWPAKVQGVFLNTYMPGTTSPLRYSPDSQALAYMVAKGRVAIRSLHTGAELATLQTPQPAQTQPETWQHHQDATLQLAFAHDGSALAVLGEWGVGVWRCGQGKGAQP